VTGVSQGALDFLTKQPVDGILLSARLAAGTPSAEEAVQYAIAIGTELHQAHSRGMVHGKLSPESIAITAAGAQVLDPPLHAPESTAAYRAPEQVRGETPDSRTDIFAFGAILYEMTVGTRAFPAEGPDLNRSLLRDPAPTLTLRSPIYDAMARVIAGCLEKNPSARRQRIQNAVIELRFAAKTQSILSGAAGRPVAPAWTPVKLVPVPPPIAAPNPIGPAGPPPTATLHMKPKPVELPKAEEFFFRPGEPVIRPRPPKPQWASLFEPGGILAVSGFRMRLWMAIAACLVVLAGVAVGAVLYLRPHSSAPVVKFAVAPPEHTSYPGSPSVSPDGKQLVFSAQGPEGQRMLWLRPLDAMRHSPIPGTEGATNPFWSPDGQYLAYFSGRALKMVRVKDYATETICKVEGTNGGGSWNRDGAILFSRNIDDGIFQVAAKPNSNPSLVLKVNPGKGENAYVWPQFLPDGKHFLFFVQTEAAETTGVYTAALDSNDYRLLFASETNALYSGLPDGRSQKNGYLLYIGNRKLMGLAFNAAHLSIVGEPVTLADDIGAVSSMNLAPITVANNGTLAYQSTGKATRQLLWMDRSGTQLAAVREPGEWGPPRIAPDGRRAVVARLGEDSKNADIWLVENDGSMKSFLHVDRQSEGSPVWSPDGSKVAFWTRSQDSNYDIYVRSIDGSGRPDLLFRSAFAKHPTDWSRDGRYLFFDGLSEGTKDDVWAVSTADRHAGPILNTVSSEQYAALSPDGKWLAYNSDETNRPEVYVQQFDGINSGTKKRWRVSAGGGGLPRWRADGKELFYLTPNGRVMSVTVQLNGSDPAFGTPTKLFQTRPLRKFWNLYDVSPDGQRFLVNAPLEWALSSDIMVVTNWTEKLKD
jgi:Tol biopolymer transport system component